MAVNIGKLYLGYVGIYLSNVAIKRSCQYQEHLINSSFQLIHSFSYPSSGNNDPRTEGKLLGPVHEALCIFSLHPLVSFLHFCPVPAPSYLARAP